MSYLCEQFLIFHHHEWVDWSQSYCEIIRDHIIYVFDSQPSVYKIVEMLRITMTCKVVKVLLDRSLFNLIFFSYFFKLQKYIHPSILKCVCKSFVREILCVFFQYYFSRWIFINILFSNKNIYIYIELRNNYLSLRQ